MSLETNSCLIEQINKLLSIEIYLRPRHEYTQSMEELYKGLMVTEQSVNCHTSM